MDKYKQKLIHALSDINTDGEVVRWIERNFPELCESEDERIRNCLNCLTSLDQSIDVIEDMGLTRQQVLAWIEKQKEHFRDFTKKVEQKPAEWSEEDKSFLDSIEEAVSYCYDRCHALQCNRWLEEKLNALRSRPKSSDNWKPQPKEEGCDYITPDKEFFQWIYDRLVYVHKEDPNVDYMRSFKKRIDNSVFDQYHWKPSEEQMSMLLAVINDPNNAGSESCHLALKSIYEQLKKL